MEHWTLEQAAKLAKHKIEQTLAGQYPEGQALQAALEALNSALTAPTADAMEAAQQVMLAAQPYIEFNLNEYERDRLLQSIAAALTSAARAQQEADALYVESVKSYYPADVFIEPPAGEHGATVDACSARAARHVCDAIARGLRSQEQK